MTSDQGSQEDGIARGAASSLGPRFRYLWATFVVASTGDGFGYGAVPLLALVVDPRPLAVSGVAAADTFPWLVLALPAGALADRYERGRVMAFTNMGRAIVLATLAILVATRSIDYFLLVILVFLNGGARAVYYSASQATVPELVEQESFSRANGILSGTESATEHLGGPILGTLAFVVSKAIPFIAEASAVGLSGLSLLRFRTERLQPGPAHSSILEGVRRLWKDRSLRILVSLLAALAGLQGLATGVLVIVATVDWHVPRGLYGLFLAVGAAGNVPGALLADRIARRIGDVATVIASAFVSGLAYLIMATAGEWLVAGVAFFIGCFAVCCGSVVSVSLRQRLSPPNLMGRIGSAWRGLVWGAIPLGALIGGELANVGGLRLPMLIAGLAQCIVAVVVAAPLARGLAASEQGMLSLEGVQASTGPARSEQDHSGSVNGDRAVAPGIGIEAPRMMPEGRRLHSRPGRGPFYWARSSRSSRR